MSQEEVVRVPRDFPGLRCLRDGFPFPQEALDAEDLYRVQHNDPVGIQQSGAQIHAVAGLRVRPHKKPVFLAPCGDILRSLHAPVIMVWSAQPVFYTVSERA